MSAKRKAASRANGAKSTGPKTPETKAASAANAVTHGLTARNAIVLPCENPAAWDALLQGCVALREGNALGSCLRVASRCAVERVRVLRGR